MHPSEFEQFDEQPAWRAVLEMYAQLQTSAVEGWVPRLAEVPNVSPTQLSGIHGRLIALGFLKFEWSPKVDGMVYQLTPSARQALTPPEQRHRLAELLAATDAADSDSADSNSNTDSEVSSEQQVASTSESLPQSRAA